MVQSVPSSGSCVRCQRSLGLASVKVGGRWYGRATCAYGGECPLDEHAPAVNERALYARPRRYFRARAPKELKRPWPVAVRPHPQAGAPKELKPPKD